MAQWNAANNITGAWVLDLARSDSFEAYLLCLGTPPQAIRAQVAGEREVQSRNVIALSNSHLVIHKRTAVNNFTESFKLDEEKITPARPWNRSPEGAGGTNQVRVCLGDDGQLDGYVVATTTCGPGGRESIETVEVRQLVEGGQAHIQQINMQNLANGGQCVVMRYWVRVAMTEEDHARIGM